MSRWIISENGLGIVIKKIESSDSKRIKDKNKNILAFEYPITITFSLSLSLCHPVWFASESRDIEIYFIDYVDSFTRPRIISRPVARTRVHLSAILITARREIKPYCIFWKNDKRKNFFTLLFRLIKPTFSINKN